MYTYCCKKNVLFSTCGCLHASNMQTYQVSTQRVSCLLHYFHIVAVSILQYVTSYLSWNCQFAHNVLREAFRIPASCGPPDRILQQCPDCQCQEFLFFRNRFYIERAKNVKILAMNKKIKNKNRGLSKIRRYSNISGTVDARNSGQRT